MADCTWSPFDNGATIGQTGSEQGVIELDEEYASEARITLEHDTRSAPFAITCGIYGSMMHTRFLGSRDEAIAQFASMKDDLSNLLDAADKSEESDFGRQLLLDGIDRFVEKYP